MAAILFIYLVSNKNNAFLYHYKILNIGQSGFNCLKDDQIKIITKYSKANLVDPYYEWESESLFSCYIAEIGSNHYCADSRRLR